MKIDEALYQLKQNIKMHKIEGTTSNQNEREKALLDYITNLQEEIHKKEAMYDSLAVDYRLSQEENEKVHKDFDELSERYFFTKSRNEQAIRYIERCRDYHRDIHKEERIFPDEITSLLMILNGDE